MLYVFLLTFFSLPFIFTLVAANISHFLTAAIKFSCFSSNKIVLLFTVETRGCLKCKISPRLTWKGGPTDDFLRIKISWMHIGNQNFLTRGTGLRALRVRESSAKTKFETRIFNNERMRLSILWRIMEIEEGVTASTDNTLRDLHNSSYDTKDEFNNCFIQTIHSK